MDREDMARTPVFLLLQKKHPAIPARSTSKDSALLSIPAFSGVGTGNIANLAGKRRKYLHIECMAQSFRWVGMEPSGGTDMMKSVSARDQGRVGHRLDFRDGYAKIGMAPLIPNQGVQTHESNAPDDAHKALAGSKLLIVEDEYLIGQDLAHGPQCEGIDVLGPYASTASAIDVLQRTDDVGAAILDLNISGHIAFDLAEKLAERNIPFIFYTGYDSVIVPDKFRKINRVRKPAEWSEIKKALFARNDTAGSSQRLVKQLSGDAPALASLLPALQRRAREITISTDMAERLVERTLERAIHEIAACPAGMPMEDWLIGLLESTGIGDHRHLH
jgi:FixJ family two-component response regulator